VVGPSDDPDVVNSTREHPGVVQLLDPAAIRTSRMAIKFTRATHSKGLVGALFIKPKNGNDFQFRGCLGAGWTVFRIR